MTKIIKRRVVIKALRTEQLTQGSFFMSENLGCNVCAVGAILRHVSFETWWRKQNLSFLDINDLGYAACKNELVSNKDGVKINLENKNYLGALSCYFENLRGTPKNNKNNCIRFVKKYFPKSFELTIEDPSAS